METIKVVILPGGKTAKELNWLQKPVRERGVSQKGEFENHLKLWHEVEKKLRIFSIQGDKCDCPGCLTSNDPVYYSPMPRREGIVYEAKIINKTKIII